MLALRMTDSIPRYVLVRAVGAVYQPAFYGPLAPLRYGDIPDPQLPGPDWVKIRTVYGGICGTDLHTITLRTSVSLSAITSFPFVVGHENVGIIEEVGPQTGDLQPGERVVINPLLTCEPRGFSQPCEYCARGEYSLCRNFTEGKLKPGLGIGGCADTGGSWGEYFVAHKSQVYRVPANVSDEAALLTEPLTVGMHAVLPHMPGDDQTVLVVGAGVIGQGTVAALRAAGCQARIIVAARHGFQADMARRMGASEVLTSRGEKLLAEVANLTGARFIKPLMGPKLMVGGVDVAYECVGSENSIYQCLATTRSGGRLVLTGLAVKPSGLDWTPIWTKELTLQGTSCSGVSEVDGRMVNDYERALDWMASGAVDMAPLLTHTFTLDEYKTAFATTLHRKHSGALKTAFRYL
ncbi:MAG: zinc-dependent alcohol dehydrogenase [Anaerolineae bacterium]